MDDIGHVDRNRDLEDNPRLQEIRERGMDHNYNHVHGYEGLDPNAETVVLEAEQKDRKEVKDEASEGPPKKR